MAALNDNLTTSHRIAYHAGNKLFTAANRTLRVQIADGSILNITEGGNVVLVTITLVESQRVAIAFADAAERNTLFLANHVCHGNVCHQHGLHGLTISVSHLLYKGHPVVSGIYLEIRYSF